jgi:hypothetical protein
VTEPYSWCFLSWPSQYKMFVLCQEQAKAARYSIRGRIWTTRTLTVCRRRVFEEKAGANRQEIWYLVCRNAVAKAVRVTEQWQVVVDRGESRVAWALQKAALSPALLATSAPQTTRPLDTDCSRRIATVTSARSCSHTCARNIAQRTLSSSAIGSCG